MKSKDFEKYAVGQLVWNLALLAVAVACSVAVLIMLRGGW